jgi:transposase
MDIIGIDLHKRESQLCIIGEDGAVTARRIVTSRDHFTAVLRDRVGARALVEASTESEWVARHLESLGLTVIVADPNYAPMYATRRRRVKTDKRDARTLAEALRLGAYRVAHRVSAERRHVRAELAVREALVRARTRYISLAKGTRAARWIARGEQRVRARARADRRAAAGGQVNGGTRAALHRARSDQRADRGGGSSHRRADARRSCRGAARDDAVDRLTHRECDRGDDR